MRVFLPVMVDVARAAGDLALEYLASPHRTEVQFKGQADLLCEADRAVEELIRERLLESFEDVAFEGEEGGRYGDRNAEFCWLVDPIDGTTNYLNDLPFTVSIALLDRNETIAGVVHNPVGDELFSAARGQGAFLNDRPIRVSDQTDPARYIIGTGLPLDQHRFSQGSYERLHRLREQVAAVRILGSCANTLAHVACGRLDGYLEGPTGYVDFAAGVLLVQEAGGVVTDFWGEADWETNLTTTVGSKTCQPFLVDHTRHAPRN